MWVHGRSPLGRVQNVRASVLIIPWLTAVSLMLAGKRYGDSYINPESYAELDPLKVPFFLASAIITFLVRLRLTPQSHYAFRLGGMYVTYILAFLAGMIGLIYFLAGAHILWAIAGYVLIVAALWMIPVSKFGYDLSPNRY
jgi:hypothetical protein